MQNQHHDVYLSRKINELQVDGRDSIKDRVISEKPMRGRLRIMIMDNSCESCMTELATA